MHIKGICKKEDIFWSERFKNLYQSSSWPLMTSKPQQGLSHKKLYIKFRDHKEKLALC